MLTEDLRYDCRHVSFIQPQCWNFFQISDIAPLLETHRKYACWGSVWEITYRWVLRYIIIYYVILCYFLFAFVFEYIILLYLTVRFHSKEYWNIWGDNGEMNYYKILLIANHIFYILYDQKKCFTILFSVVMYEPL